MDISKSGRLLSVDALRGFDMLLISGGAGFLVRMKGITDLPWVDQLANQMTHPAWNGFTFYDFIFPLFLFISGVSLAFSVTKSTDLGLQKASIYRKAFRRMIILIVLGIIYKNAPLPLFEPSQIRLGSVLGRIGIATFFTTLLVVNYHWQQRLIWVGGILLAYFAAVLLIPVPGYGAGDLSFEGNLVGWFDRTFLPGRLRQGTYDELGLLTQAPALCLTVLGAWAGEILSFGSHNKKLAYLCGIGIIGVLIGLAWGQVFPINKHLWSSSFILLTAGMSFLFLAGFYWVIDVKGYTKWAFFFKVIGMNSLLVYYVYRFVDFNYTSELLFGGIYGLAPEAWQLVFQALGATLLVWLFLYVMYKNKIFIKV
jgi:predicted acyltransferase